MRQLLAILAFLFAVAASADAQTPPLDWADGTGSLRCSDPRAVGGSPSETLTCRARIPSASFSVTVNCLPGEVRTFAAPSHVQALHDAFAECAGTIVPGVYGASTPATPVSLRQPEPSALPAPTLLP